MGKRALDVRCNRFERNGQTRFLRIRQVLALVPVSRPTIYRMMERGEFPKALRIGSSSLWVEAEINKWMNDKVAER